MGLHGVVSLSEGLHGGCSLCATAGQDGGISPQSGCLPVNSAPRAQRDPMRNICRVQESRGQSGVLSAIFSSLWDFRGPEATTSW
jgi:hypothetical protein